MDGLLAGKTPIEQGCAAIFTQENLADEIAGEVMIEVATSSSRPSTAPPWPSF